MNADSIRTSIETWAKDESITWVFHHIPKTAGTAVRNAIASQLKPVYNIFVPPDAEKPNFDSAIDRAFEEFLHLRQRQNFRFVCGHLERRHILRLLEIQNVKVITFLRDPFHRLISDYRYQQTERHPYSVAFREEFPTFRSFIENEASQNRMVSFLAGQTHFDSYAERIITEDYAFCGVLEMLPVCFGIICKMMGITAAVPPKSNVAPDMVPNEIMQPQQDRQLFLEKNKADQQLYELVFGQLMDIRQDLRQLLGWINT